MSLYSRLMDPLDPSLEMHDVAGIALLGTHVGMAVHMILHGVAVDLSGFGTGAAALIAAIGGAGWMKGKQRAVDPCLAVPTATMEKTDAQP